MSLYHGTNNYGYGCRQSLKLIRTHVIRPYYEDSEQLEILVVCPECGAYEFEEFEKKDPKDESSTPKSDLTKVDRETTEESLK